MMSEYYTTKQVQDLFKVDRITVYRMLQDGRLKGVKIGKQWRFHQSEIERFLGGETAVISMDPDVNQNFPVHCVQTIQDLFSSVSKMSALIVDNQGNPVTEISRNCRFCQLVMSTPEGKAACADSWKELTNQGAVENNLFSCHAGLNYVGTSITYDQELQGFFLMGQFFLGQDEKRKFQDRILQLAQKYALSIEDLTAAASQIPVISAENQADLLQQPAAAAKAVESIFIERGAFLKRLQEIANLTQNI